MRGGSATSGGGVAGVSALLPMPTSSVLHMRMSVSCASLSFASLTGVPGDGEARRMIDEASEVVVAFNEARARGEIVGSEKAEQVSEGAVEQFAALCRRELSE